MSDFPRVPRRFSLIAVMVATLAVMMAAGAFTTAHALGFLASTSGCAVCDHAEHHHSDGKVHSLAPPMSGLDNHARTDAHSDEDCVHCLICHAFDAPLTTPTAVIAPLVPNATAIADLRPETETWSDGPGRKPDLPPARRG